MRTFLLGPASVKYGFMAVESKCLCFSGLKFLGSLGVGTMFLRRGWMLTLRPSDLGTGDALLDLDGDALFDSMVVW